MKRRPLARDCHVRLTMAHDDWEVSSVTGCGAMVDVVTQSKDATLDASASSLTGEWHPPEPEA